jgi:hypothetical protein
MLFSLWKNILIKSKSILDFIRDDRSSDYRYMILQMYPIWKKYIIILFMIFGCSNDKYWLIQFWLYCLDPVVLLLPNLLGFPVFRFWAYHYLMKVIPETRRAH